MKTLTFLTFLLACSCTKYAEFSKDSVGIHIAPVKMKVSRLEEITWLVGRPKKDYITQSITFTVDTPKIKQDNLDYLSKNYNVDAWILRLIVQRGSDQQDLGSLYIPFRPNKVARTNQTNVPNNASFKIYYAAAFASERFRRLNCPVFDHNFRIRNMDIKGEPKEFSLTVGQSTSYPEKSQIIHLSPSSFNGGNSLKGEYFIEIAPYDSKRKNILSSFTRIPQSVVIISEEGVNIRNCAGVHSDVR